MYIFPVVTKLTVATTFSRAITRIQLLVESGQDWGKVSTCVLPEVGINLREFPVRHRSSGVSTDSSGLYEKIPYRGK